MTLDTKRLIMGTLSFMFLASKAVISYKETHRKRKEKKAEIIKKKTNKLKSFRIKSFYISNDNAPL